MRVSENPKVLHLLYWGGCLVARCRTLDELVAAIDAHLGGHGPVPAGGVRLSGLLVRNREDAVVLTHADQTYGAKLSGRLRSVGAWPEVRPWIDADPANGQVLPAGSIGLLGSRAVEARLRALLVPDRLAELDPADRLIAMQRNQALVLGAGDLVTAADFVRSTLTESVGNASPAHVAERLGTLLARNRTIEATERPS